MSAADQALEALATLLLPVMEQKKGRQYGLNGYMSGLALGEKHDTPGGAGQPSGLIYSHGPNGLLSFPGVDPIMFNAAMGSDSLLSMIPATGSLFTDPTYYTLTGITGDTGSEKTGVCDNAPTAGLMKGCLTTSPFGRYERATPQMEINRMGQRTDRADPMDLRLIGDPVFAGQNSVFASGPGGTMRPADLLTNEVSRKFWELGISFHRLLSRQVWRGTPANNTAGGGYKEFPGLPQLVNTGYVDAETGTTCPAADSYVRNFGFQRVDSATGSANIVATVTDMYYQLKDRARRMGLSPVRWVIAMRPQLFYELTAVWPCSYLAFRCNVATGSTNFIDAQDAIRFRDEMRSGRYLLIDGDRIDVVADDQIPEDSNTTSASVPSGCFGSSIYFLPMSVVGGQSVLYLEYFQYSNPSIEEAMGQMILGRIEGGFITWPKQTNLCVQWQSKIEPRLVLRTPQIAGRIRNVVYCPIQHTRDSFPSDPYFANGGKTSRPSGPSYFSVWRSNPASVT